MIAALGQKTQSSCDLLRAASTANAIRTDSAVDRRWICAALRGGRTSALQRRGERREHAGKDEDGPEGNVRVELEATQRNQHADHDREEDRGHEEPRDQQ